MIGTLLASGAGAIATWFGTNLLGKPVLALREKRLEALQVAERYSRVDFASSDELRRTAMKALSDVGHALRALHREASLGVRLWCWLMGYDLDIAARCLFGLTEGPRGKYSLSPIAREKTLNALYVSLRATGHLSSEQVEAAKRDIEGARHPET